MIKVRDNFNLEHLDNFGFEFKDSSGCYEKVYYGYTLYQIRTWSRELIISKIPGGIRNDVSLDGLCELFNLLEFRS